MKTKKTVEKKPKEKREPRPEKPVETAPVAAVTECNDRHCPVHGSIKVRGNVFEGIVVSDKMNKSVVVERKLLKFIPKYERYARTRSKIVAHVPPCMTVKTGDNVEIGETKKISKTKNFVVIKVGK